ncbi:MAG: transposase [Anaerolineaceae bacterium]|nr:transposase [Anaerolineaceae bacterium]
MTRKRKHYSPEDKVRLVKEHLINGVPVSEICEKNQLQPTVFYRWQKQLFEGGAAAFSKDEEREAAQLKKQISKLEGKLTSRNEVISELMEAHVNLKKSFGEN